MWNTYGAIRHLFNNYAFDFQIFVEDIKSDCSIKRRCASHNVITLIEKSRKPERFSTIALNMALGEFCQS